MRAMLRLATRLPEGISFHECLPTCLLKFAYFLPNVTEPTYLWNSNREDFFSRSRKSFSRRRSNHVQHQLWQRVALCLDCPVIFNSNRLKLRDCDA